MLTLEDLVAQIKREVLEDMRSGRVPSNVRSYGNLHDYVDANCYGGMCEDERFDACIAQFGGRDEHEGMPDGMIDLLNNAHDAVGEWLRNGEHLKEL